MLLLINCINFIKSTAIKYCKITKKYYSGRSITVCCVAILYTAVTSTAIQPYSPANMGSVFSLFAITAAPLLHTFLCLFKH